jgi:exosortase
MIMHSTGGVANASLKSEHFFLPSPSLPVGIKVRNALALFLLIGTIVWFWQPLTALYGLTQEESHYSHLLLVPFVSLYVLYLDRKILLSSKKWSPVYGLLLVGVGALGYWQAGRGTSGIDHICLTTLALVVVTWGIFLFCYGAGTCRSMSFGLLFLLCMVPFPAALLHAIIVFLQHSAAEVTNVGFSLLGVPVIRDDIVFGLSNITIRVDEGCSAIRSAISLVITSIVAGRFFLRSTQARIGVVVAMIPLAIINNGIRIVGLSLLANYVNKSFLLDGHLHDLVGHLVFVLSIAILIVLISVLRRLEQRPTFYPPVQADVTSNVAAANEPL